MNREVTEDLIYYGHTVDRMREELAKNTGEPAEWSDGAKLRLLADLFDAADLIKGNLNPDVQRDLRRMAGVLDAL